MSIIFAMLLGIALLLSACGTAAPTPEPTAEPETPAETVAETPTEPAEEPTPEEEPVTVRVGSLKGPTTMGLVRMMAEAEAGELEDLYEFTIATQADELAAGIVGGSLDIALIPANLAAVLYQRTDGGIAVLDVNTLGVLYCVTGDESVAGVADLAGRTVILTGQGTTPEYALRYLLDAYGVTDAALEFKSEAAEVAAALQNDPTQIAVLPQPFATAAQLQNTALHEAFGLTDAWDAVSNDSRLLTGVTVVRRPFLDEHPDAVRRFLGAQTYSAAQAAVDTEGIAELVVKYGILEKAPVAMKALPKCGIVCVTGAEMKTALEGYLTVLFNADPKSVGGALPGEDFYFDEG